MRIKKKVGEDGGSKRFNRKGGNPFITWPQNRFSLKYHFPRTVSLQTKMTIGCRYENKIKKPTVMEILEES